MDPVDRRGVVALSDRLVRGERVVAASRQHWMSLTGPVGGVLVGLVLVLAIGVRTPDWLNALSDLAWWVWFVLVVNAIVRTVGWYHDWFVATDQRLLLRYGLLDRQIDMMPIAKVTDLTFKQPILGRLLGYGTFVLESAGQDQALHAVHFLPHPQQTYLAICEEIFGRPDEDARPARRPDGPGDETGAGSGPVGTPSEGASGGDDPPAQRPGGYLERTAPSSGPFRSRLLRGPDAPDQQLRTAPATDDTQVWTVSHEDAPGYQRLWRQDGDSSNPR